MAPRVPGARSQLRAGPAPLSLTSSGPTLSLSRGGRPRGQVRGGAAHLPGSGPTPGRTWAGPLCPRPGQGGVGWQRALDARPGLGGATSFPPSVGLPGRLDLATPYSPQKRVSWLKSPPSRWLQTNPKREFSVLTPLQSLHLSLCHCFSPSTISRSLALLVLSLLRFLRRNWRCGLGS